MAFPLLSPGVFRRESVVEESLQVEGLLLPPQVVNGSSQFRFEHGSGFAFAAFLLLSLAPATHFRAATFHQASGFAERPFQMCIADLLGTSSLHLARAGMLTAYQSRVRQPMTMLLR